ncbi:MAG: hypothetical protein EOM20_15205 [Spartobacteria bacterium]|nr:hypothetical protein [Spartobacteria bacterium]
MTKQPAHVTSIEALRQFRARLIVYQDKAAKALDEVAAELARTRQWLEGEQHSYWAQQLKQRGRALEEAKQTLLRARMSSLRQTSSAEQLAVKKAERELAHAREKMRAVKKWRLQFDNQVIPLTGQLSRLHTFLSGDLPGAIRLLNQTITHLEDYLHTPLPGTATPSAARTPEPGGAS